MDSILPKMQKWCAYQERSQNETRLKLYGFGIRDEACDEIISQLISENYINDERFAGALASGKFRIKRWGKIKIKNELRKHKISDYSINKALNSIDGEEYIKTLERLLEKKWELTKQKDLDKKFYVLVNYALTKGFELNLIKERLEKFKTTLI